MNLSVLFLKCIQLIWERSHQKMNFGFQKKSLTHDIVCFIKKFLRTGLKNSPPINEFVSLRNFVNWFWNGRPSKMCLFQYRNVDNWFGNCPNFFLFYSFHEVVIFGHPFTARFSSKLN